MTIHAGYIGLDKHSSKRVWGWFYSDEFFSKEIHIFWGLKGKDLKFVRSIRDTDFYSRSKKKRKVYEDIRGSSLAENIVEEYMQYLLVRKLKNG